jgi:hypothetical protein
MVVKLGQLNKGCQKNNSSRDEIYENKKQDTLGQNTKQTHELQRH